jgi:hypothetical protein
VLAERPRVFHHPLDHVTIVVVFFIPKSDLLLFHVLQVFFRADERANPTQPLLIVSAAGTTRLSVPRTWFLDFVWSPVTLPQNPLRVNH